jgi:16S rRNA (guanine527-N7)-methyltransferase
VGKKANAVDDIVQKLGLQVPVYSTRVQDLLQDFRYSSLVARAVGPLPKMLQWLSEHWQNFDRLLAIKGPRWVEERAEARHRGLLRGIELRKIADYAMPDRTSHSVILQLRRPRPGQAIESD